jgi:hypothetical protein
MLHPEQFTGPTSSSSSCTLGSCEPTQGINGLVLRPLYPFFPRPYIDVERENRPY